MAIRPVGTNPFVFEGATEKFPAARSSQENHSYQSTLDAIPEVEEPPVTQPRPGSLREWIENNKKK